MNGLATIFLACGNDGLEIFFDQAFKILVITCMDLPLVIVYASSVAATFTQAAAATVVPTIASTGMDAGKISG